MVKILIVDDTRSVHAFVKSLLSKSKEIVTEGVFDGSEALNVLKENKFDLILLDWEMPHLNGPSTFEQLTQMRIAVPTIMMTTKNSPEDIEKMLNLGVAEYLMKPFTIDILFEKINAALGRELHYAS